MRSHTLALTGALAAGTTTSITVAAITGIPAYYGGALTLGVLSLIGLADYAARPITLPELDVDGTPTCDPADCPLATSCDYCDRPLCALHGDDEDLRNCADSALHVHCPDCEDAHIDDCLTCQAVTAGRW